MVMVMELYFTLKRFKIALLGPELCEGPSVSDLVLSMDVVTLNSQAKHVIFDNFCWPF